MHRRAGKFFLDVEHQKLGTFQAGLKFFDQHFKFSDFKPHCSGDFGFIHIANMLDWLSGKIQAER